MGTDIFDLGVCMCLVEGTGPPGRERALGLSIPGLNLA